MISRIALILGLVLASAGNHAAAEQAKNFGEYTVHYSAFTTDMLPPDVARIYGITRSSNRALLNISVLQKVMETTVKPVSAEVVASATNLSAQLKTFDMREINDQGAIYYVAEIPVNHRETLRFNISVRPEGAENAYRFSFNQQFFTD